MKQKLGKKLMDGGAKYVPSFRMAARWSVIMLFLKVG